MMARISNTDREQIMIWATLEQSGHPFGTEASTMKHILLAIFIATITLPAMAPNANAAGKIQRACLKSDRAAVSRPLCRCIQKTANRVLTRKDRTLAAKFFKDPQMAQDVRQSDNPSKEAFWKRYKEFGSTAAAICGS